MNKAQAQARAKEIKNMSDTEARELLDRAWKNYLDTVEREGYEKPKSRPAPDPSRRPCEI